MGSFRKRLLVLIIGLVIVTQTVTLAAVLASTAHNVEGRAAEQLRSGSSFVQQLIRFRGGQLANGVAVLAVHLFVHLRFRDERIVGKFYRVLLLGIMQVDVPGSRQSLSMSPGVSEGSSADSACHEGRMA